MVVGFLLLVAAELAFFCAVLGPAPAGLLGTIVLAAGALSFHAVICRTGWPGGVLQNVAATLYLVAGTWLALGPQAHAPVIAGAIAFFMLGGGLHSFAQALTQRHLHWKWSALSACAGMLLGTKLMLELPAISVAVLATIVGAQFALAGIAWLGFAWSGWRSYQHDYMLLHIRRPPRMPGY